MNNREIHPLAQRVVAAVTMAMFGLSGIAVAQSPASPDVAQPSTAQTTSTEKTFSQEQLDQLVAPVALYPDELLAQVLMASTYPLEIV